VRANLSRPEAAVLSLLESYWTPGGRLSQLDIANSEKWLGCHRHENGRVRNAAESTLRKVRQIIQDLRRNHGIPVLSDRDGYFLPSTSAEGEEYIVGLERQSRAAAASYMVTYHAMRKTLGVTNRFFEAVGDGDGGAK